MTYSKMEFPNCPFCIFSEICLLSISLYAVILSLFFIYIGDKLNDVHNYVFDRLME